MLIVNIVREYCYLSYTDHELQAKNTDSENTHFCLNYHYPPPPSLPPSLPTSLPSIHAQRRYMHWDIRPAETLGGAEHGGASLWLEEAVAMVWLGFQC